MGSTAEAPDDSILRRLRANGGMRLAAEAVLIEIQNRLSTPTFILPQDNLGEEKQKKYRVRSSQMRQHLLAEELEALHRLGAARAERDAAPDDEVVGA